MKGALEVARTLRGVVLAFGPSVLLCNDPGMVHDRVGQAFFRWMYAMIERAHRARDSRPCTHPSDLQETVRIAIETLSNTLYSAIDGDGLRGDLKKTVRNTWEPVQGGISSSRMWKRRYLAMSLITSHGEQV